MNNTIFNSDFDSICLKVFNEKNDFFPFTINKKKIKSVFRYHLQEITKNPSFYNNKIILLDSIPYSLIHFVINTIRNCNMSIIEYDFSIKDFEKTNIIGSVNSSVKQ